MNMQLPYSSKLVNADKVMETLAGSAQRAENLTRPLTRLGEHLVRKTARILQSGERGVQSRHASSGLGASLNYRVFFGAGLVIGSNKAQAAVLQFGGVVSSSRPGGYLAIPIADNLKGSGDPKFVSPRLVPDGMFFRSASGALLFGRVLNKRTANRRKTARGLAAKSLMRYRSEAAKIELLFALKQSVSIPEFRYCSFDPADKVLWEQYATEWVVRGR